MKKTTWVIIGLSVCVAVLASALGIVLTQQQTETIMAKEPDLYKPMDFRIAPSFETIQIYYYSSYSVSDYFVPSYTVPEPGKKVDFLGEKIPGFPGKVMFLKRTNQ